MLCPGSCWYCWLMLPPETMEIFWHVPLPRVMSDLWPSEDSYIMFCPWLYLPLRGLWWYLGYGQAPGIMLVFGDHVAAVSLLIWVVCVTTGTMVASGLIKCRQGPYLGQKSFYSLGLWWYSCPVLKLRTAVIGTILFWAGPEHIGPGMAGPVPC